VQILLNALWGGSVDLPGAVTFWFTGERDKTSFHLPLSQVSGLADADHLELAELAGKSNVYFGNGLRRLGLTEHQQGGRKDVIALPALVLDIDFADRWAHKAQNLPADLDEAAVLLDDVPDPSIVVGTGNGVHLYWLFKEPLLLNTTAQRLAAAKAVKKFQGGIIARAQEHGWHLDDTHSIQRVWRVPGFINRKNDKPVELWHCDADVRYDLAELGLKVKGAEWTTAPTPIPVPSVSWDQEEANLSELRDQLQMIRSDMRWHKAIQAALKGESMAKPGARDLTLQGVCSTIAWLPSGRKASSKQLAEILRPSLTEWTKEETAKLTVEQEMVKAADKIGRSQEDYWDQQRKARPLLEGIAHALGVSLKSNGKAAPDNDFFLRHAIIQYRSAFYVFDWRYDRYSGAKTDRELVTVCRDAWANGPAALSIRYNSDKGKPITKKTARLCEEYCTVVDRVIGDLNIERSRFELLPPPNAGIQFREAFAIKRVTDEEFSPQIDEWLRLFAADQYGILCDWIATATKLDEPNSCLYLDGFSGSGKSLLAKGLARLWHEGDPTAFRDAVGAFNDDLGKCPLVWIDEGLGGHKNLTEQVRRLVAQHSFTMSAKFLPNRSIQGALRLMICANNDEILNDPKLSTQDEQAMVKRILYIKTHEAAERYLVEHGGRDFTTPWVEGDGLARHCLYLQKNRTVKRAGRFLVEGDSTEMHRKLVITGDANGQIYEWITRFATDPKPAQLRWGQVHQRPLAIIGGGQILICAEGLLDCWEVYMTEKIQKPSAHRAGRVIKKVSQGRTRLGPRGDRVWFHCVKPELILAWCEANQVGNQDRIEDNLHEDLGQDERQPA
jgi:hypothetical protein